MVTDQGKEYGYRVETLGPGNSPRLLYRVYAKAIDRPRTVTSFRWPGGISATVATTCLLIQRRLISCPASNKSIHRARAVLEDQPALTPANAAP